jgi:hypothetical protein
MKGWKVLQIIKRMSKLEYIVTYILYDKDASTMKNILQIFQNIQENFCYNIIFAYFK